MTPTDALLIGALSKIMEIATDDELLALGEMFAEMAGNEEKRAEIAAERREIEAKRSSSG
jgi:hypothetical protein